MKPSMLIFCLMSVASMLLAQTNLDTSRQKKVMAGDSAKNAGIVFETGMLTLKGREITTAHSLIKCLGDCEMIIHSVILKADALDFHQDTGEAEAHGNVRVQLLPHGTAAAQ